MSSKKIRAEQKVNYHLNKYKGVICTNSDPAGRKKTKVLVHTYKEIFCVDRLNSHGLGFGKFRL